MSWTLGWTCFCTAGYHACCPIDCNAEEREFTTEIDVDSMTQSTAYGHNAGKIRPPERPRTDTNTDERCFTIGMVQVDLQRGDVVFREAPLFVAIASQAILIRCPVHIF